MLHHPRHNYYIYETHTHTHGNELHMQPATRHRAAIGGFPPEGLSGSPVTCATGVQQGEPNDILLQGPLIQLSMLGHRQDEGQQHL